MALRYICDICNKVAEKPIRVGIGDSMYCEKCWRDEKNWKKIHENAVKDSSSY